MLFHSFAFFVLFSVCAVGYWQIARPWARVWWLLIASIVFYAFWSPGLVLVVLGTGIVDYVLAIRLETASEPRRRKQLLTLSLALSLGLLGFFKYSNFFLETLWIGWGAVAAPPARPHLALIMPLGISFYTFETISYIVDVYHGKVRAERSLSRYLLFLLFFPHLIAGPIIRAHRFLPQTRRRIRFSWTRLALGARLFLLGLMKKAIVADQLSTLVDPVFAQPAAYGQLAAWTAATAYAVQVYCDFSGYSDMAVGCAHALGYKLPRNFVQPFLARNIADLYRRWNVTLGEWLRDYVYIPLGGSRHGPKQTCRNLFLTMLVSGLWHGAAWTFVAWGAIQGALLAAHHGMPWPRWTGAPLLRPIRTLVTIFLFVASLAVFRASSLTDAGLLLSRMFTPIQGLSPAPAVVTLLLPALGILLLGHIAGELRLGPRFVVRLPAPVLGAALGAGLILVQLLMPDSGGAFIYFQF